jgi:hypothetical protein
LQAAVVTLSVRNRISRRDGGDLDRQPAGALGAAARAAVLGHPDRHRQLLELMTLGSPAATRSAVENTCPQSQPTGQCSTTSSTAHAGSNGRPLPSWPG